MSRNYYRPQAVARQGLQAVHQRPFCANEDSHIVGRFDAKTAWATFPKLQIQPEHAYAAILLDIDSTEGLDDAPGKSWWGGNPTPAPNWMVVNTRPRSATRRPVGASTPSMPLKYPLHVTTPLTCCPCATWPTLRTV